MSRSASERSKRSRRNVSTKRNSCSKYGLDKGKENFAEYFDKVL